MRWRSPRTHACEEPIDQVIGTDARADELRGTPDRVNRPLEAHEGLVVRARKRLHEESARGLNLSQGVEVDAERDRRWLLLAVPQIVREVLRDFGRGERDDACVRLAPRGVIAHDRQHTAPERRRDVELAVARRGMRRRIAGETADVTRRIRDHGERAKRTIPAKLQLHGLLVLCSGRDQDRAHQAAAECRGGRRGGAVTLRGVSHELGGDERAHEDATVARDGSDELVRSRSPLGGRVEAATRPPGYRGEAGASIATDPEGQVRLRSCAF